MSQVALHSMHKYEPRLTIVKHSLKGGLSEVVFSKDLTKCSFIAVTAYQSSQVLHDAPSVAT